MARVILAAFEGTQGLDVLGPGDVFGGVARLIERPAYEVVVATVGGGPFRTTSGVIIDSVDLRALRPRASDTVLVMGGASRAVSAAVLDDALVAWLARAARVVRRIGSVCAGTFVLARAGILDGHRVATHWSACSRLASFRPQLEVDADAIFVHEGRVWTSAGVTTGIDMALAMVEEDFGRHVVDSLAAWFVLYARRPGFQSQFSDALVAQREAEGSIAAALDWARANLRALTAARLARRSGMSLRTFHRRCAEQLRTTPAKLVERLRLEHARTLLATTTLGTKSVAVRCGFGSAARMTRAFKRALGVAPREFAVLHGRGQASASSTTRGAWSLVPNSRRTRKPVARAASARLAST